MQTDIIKELQLAAEEGHPITEEAALAVLRTEAGDVPEIMACANTVRTRYFGDKIYLCSILNAKSGACAEDCAFCAQSSHHRTNAEVYGLKSKEEMMEAYGKATDLPISNFGIVTSGPTVDGEAVSRICDAVRECNGSNAAWCASLGALDAEQLKLLKRAGLKRFHHNLETAESFFPNICTTHTYTDRLGAIRAVKAAGLEVCCGGILGMGESPEQRVEFALALRREKVDAIPLNFLVPIPGTGLENISPMKPLDIIRCIIMFRMTNPDAEVKVCAGRTHLRDLQSMIFHAGATGMMIGPLLTVAGRDVDEDLRMLQDLEMNHELRAMD